MIQYTRGLRRSLPNNVEAQRNLEREAFAALTIQYTPRGVCSRAFQIEVEDGVIRDIQIEGGCDGNLKGLSSLLKGMKAEEAVSRLEGIRCGAKATSCPDQLAQALKKAL